MSKSEDQKKVYANISISKWVHDYIEENRVPEKENRPYSNMAETLLIEAIEARKGKLKKKRN